MALRAFVNFNYDLRKPLNSKQKAKITNAFREVQELAAQPHQIYRPRNKENLEIAQRQSAGRPLKNFRVAFIGNTGHKGKVQIRSNGTVTVKSENLITNSPLFSPKKFARDPIAEIMRTARAAGGKRFAIRVGKYRTLATYDLPSLIKELEKWKAKYGGAAFVTGIVSFNFRNQKDFAAAQREFLHKRAAAKKANRSSRRRLAKKGRN